VDGIMDGTIPPERQQHYLAIVSSEVKRLSRLVRSMLNIARLESGEMQLAPTSFDINQVVCSTIFTFEKAIEEKNLDIRGLDSDRVMVSADEDLIHQVVYNLVENAVKFVDAGGYIEISYRTEEKMTYISVKNSGEGISKEEISKVFERFYKTDRSRSQDKSGVGLGLNIVRSIIKLHQGEVIVRSTEGQFCEFTFTLPTAAPKQVPRHNSGELK
ncbi:MAG: HAMP domain-containing histidine kinase, partial [Oscillospiraceae bacterium]|nr:HAMP domain-containing histidine kinase [Oscillospiraceae bacterium]